jgi:arylsulfatase A-like enzyme
MRFDLAFAASPTCTPSRSSIYTGLFPFRNGAHANHSIVHDHVKSIPAYLQALGYRVVLAGKSHIGPRERFPFEYLENSNIMPPGKKHVLWTDLNLDAVSTLLERHDRDRPLCLLVCSHSPHVYWPDNNGYDPAAITLPPYLLDTPATRAARCRYYTDVSWMDRQVGQVLKAIERHGYADHTLFIYTADQGAQWPFAKWNLYDTGIRVPLLIRWPGRVVPGTHTKALVSLVDLLPTIVEAAGAVPPPDLDGQSFLPVLRGTRVTHWREVYATHTGDKEMNRSPMRCVRTDRYKYILNLAPQTPYTTHISKGAPPDGRDYWESWLRLTETDHHARTLGDRYERRPAEELYDLYADPFEQNNLANAAAHAGLLTELRHRLEQWRLEQGESLTQVPMPEDGRTGPIRYAD